MIEGEDLELFERSLDYAVANHRGDALDAALEDLGWHEALDADPHAAVSLLFEVQGKANATSSALDAVLARGLGQTGAAVVRPAIGSWRSPGTVGPGGVRVDGLGTAALARADRAVVVAGDVAFSVDPGALSRRPVGGTDPDLGLLEVVGQVDGAEELGPVDWRVAVGLGQLALGHELVGASRRMLELARQHALDRIQFGQPIARFQAVRHRLAETLAAIEGAAAVLDAAWLDTAAPEAAAMAKATAGRAARVAARHCQQVLAGIGFTTEHDLHRYVQRALVLEQLLGATAGLTRELGRDAIERGAVPALLPL